MNFNISNISLAKIKFTGNTPANTASHDEHKPHGKSPLNQPEKDELIKSKNTPEEAKRFHKHKHEEESSADFTDKPRKTKKRERSELKKKAKKNELPPLTPEKIEEIKESKNIPEDVKAEILALPLNDPEAFNRGMQNIIEKHNDKI